MASVSTNNLYFLKSRFMCEELGIYGLFYLLVDTNTNEVEKVDVLASHFRAFIDEIAPKEAWPSCGWSQLEEIIKAAKYKGKLAEGITKDIKLSLDQLISTAEIEVVVQMIIKNEIASLEFKFNQYLRKSFNGIEAVFNFVIEKTNRAELALSEEARKEIIKDEKNLKAQEESLFEESKKKLPSDSAILDVHFVLSPVQGISISELKVGDMVMIRIASNNQKGKYFNEILGLIRGDKILAAPARVQEIQRGPSGEYFVITKIQDGIYGRIEETEQIKIRPYDPAKDEPLGNNKSLPTMDKPITSSSQMDFTATMETKDKLTIMILSGVLLAIILAVVIYLFVLK